MSTPDEQLANLQNAIRSTLLQIIDEATLKSATAQGRLQLLFDAGKEDSGGIRYTHEEMADVRKALEEAGEAKGARYAADKIYDACIAAAKRTSGENGV